MSFEEDLISEINSSKIRYTRFADMNIYTSTVPRDIQSPTDTILQKQEPAPGCILQPAYQKKAATQDDDQQFSKKVDSYNLSFDKKSELDSKPRHEELVEFVPDNERNLTINYTLMTSSKNEPSENDLEAFRRLNWEKIARFTPNLKDSMTKLIDDFKQHEKDVNDTNSALYENNLNSILQIDSSQKLIEETPEQKEESPLQDDKSKLQEPPESEVQNDTLRRQKTGFEKNSEESVTSSEDPSDAESDQTQKQNTVKGLEEKFPIKFNMQQMRIMPSGTHGKEILIQDKYNAVAQKTQKVYYQISYEKDSNIGKLKQLQCIKTSEQPDRETWTCAMFNCSLRYKLWYDVVFTVERVEKKEETEQESDQKSSDDKNGRNLEGLVGLDTNLKEETQGKNVHWGTREIEPGQEGNNNLSESNFEWIIRVNIFDTLNKVSVDEIHKNGSMFFGFKSEKNTDVQDYEKDWKILNIVPVTNALPQIQLPEFNKNKGKKKKRNRKMKDKTIQQEEFDKDEFKAWLEKQALFIVYGKEGEDGTGIPYLAEGRVELRQCTEDFQELKDAQTQLAEDELDLRYPLVALRFDGSDYTTGLRFKKAQAQFNKMDEQDQLIALIQFHDYCQGGDYTGNTQKQFKEVKPDIAVALVTKMKREGKKGTDQSVKSSISKSGKSHQIIIKERLDIATHAMIQDNCTETSQNLKKLLNEAVQNLNLFTSDSQQVWNDHFNKPYLIIYNFKENSNKNVRETFAHLTTSTPQYHFDPLKLLNKGAKLNSPHHHLCLASHLNHFDGQLTLALSVVQDGRKEGILILKIDNLMKAQAVQSDAIFLEESINLKNNKQEDSKIQKESDSKDDSKDPKRKRLENITISLLNSTIRRYGTMIESKESQNNFLEDKLYQITNTLLGNQVITRTYGSSIVYNLRHNKDLIGQNTIYVFDEFEKKIYIATKNGIQDQELDIKYQELDFPDKIRRNTVKPQRINFAEDDRSELPVIAYNLRDDNKTYENICFAILRYNKVVKSICLDVKQCQKHIDIEPQLVCSNLISKNLWRQNGDKDVDKKHRSYKESYDITLASKELKLVHIVTVKVFYASNADLKAKFQLQSHHMSIDIDVFALSILIGNCDFSQLTIEPYFVTVPNENAGTIKQTIDGSLIKINENYSFQYKLLDGYTLKQTGIPHAFMIEHDKPDCDQNIVRYAMRLQGKINAFLVMAKQRESLNSLPRLVQEIDYTNDLVFAQLKDIVYRKLNESQVNPWERLSHYDETLEMIDEIANSSQTGSQNQQIYERFFNDFLKCDPYHGYNPSSNFALDKLDICQLVANTTRQKLKGVLNQKESFFAGRQLCIVAHLLTMRTLHNSGEDFSAEELVRCDRLQKLNIWQSPMKTFVINHRKIARAALDQNLEKTADELCRLCQTFQLDPKFKQASIMFDLAERVHKYFNNEQVDQIQIDGPYKIFNDKELDEDKNGVDPFNANRKTIEDFIDGKELTEKGLGNIRLPDRFGKAIEVYQGMFSKDNNNIVIKDIIRTQFLPLHQETGELVDFSVINFEYYIYKLRDKEIQHAVKTLKEAREMGDKEQEDWGHEQMTNIIQGHKRFAMNGQKLSQLLEILLKENLGEIDQKGVIKDLIDYQFSQTIVFYRMSQAFYILIFMIPFSIQLLYEDRTTTIVCNVICFICLLLLAVFEVIKLKGSSVKKYFSSGWNINDFAQIMTYLVYFILRLSIQTETSIQATNQEELLAQDDSAQRFMRSILPYMNSIVLIEGMIKFLFFMKIDVRFGTLITLLIQCFQDVAIFTFFYVIFMLFFMIMFFNMKATYDEATDRFSSDYEGDYVRVNDFWMYFIQSFRNSLGDMAILQHDYWNKLGEQNEIESIVAITYIWIIWFIQTYVMIVIMLNFLIAIVSQSYESIMSQQTITQYVLKAELNILYMRIMKGMEANSSLIALTRLFGYVPGHFHYLVIASSRVRQRNAESSEWQGLISTIRKVCRKNTDEIIQTQRTLFTSLSNTVEIRMSQQEANMLDIKRDMLELKKNQDNFFGKMLKKPQNKYIN